MNYKLLLYCILFFLFVIQSYQEIAQENTEETEKSEQEKEEEEKETIERRKKLLEQMEQRKIEHEEQIKVTTERQKKLKEQDEIEDLLDNQEFERYIQTRKAQNQKEIEIDQEIEKVLKEIPKDWKPKQDEEELISNKEEQMKQLEEKFEFVLWGNEHPFKSYWIHQIANFAPQGKILNAELARSAEENGIKIVKFAEQGIDLEQELIYTGYIEFEQKLKEYNVLIATQCKPYIAYKPKQSKDPKIEL